MKPRPFADYRPSMAKNPLLQRAKIGRAIPTTQDLPNEDFRYGKPSQGDLSVKDIFNHWSEVDNNNLAITSRQEYKPKEDFVATNRAAIRHGCKTAHDFREFYLKHPIYKKPEQEIGNSESDFHNKCTNMTHGSKTTVSTEIQDCLTFKTGREAKERALAKKKIQSELNEFKSINSSKVSWAKAGRPTRASRGHTYQAYKSPRESETFKLKRFLNVDKGLVKTHWE